MRICISEGIVCGMGGISGGVTGRREMGCFVCVSGDWKGFSSVGGCKRSGVGVMMCVFV